MRIVFATEHLASLAGSETYLLTVAEQLERLGHDVRIWAIEQGRSAEIARENGFAVAAENGSDLPADCDAVIAQDAPTAYALADRYPRSPQLYISHSTLYELSVPPQLPGVASAIVVLGGWTERWASALAHRPEIIRLRQPIDLERFRPLGAPRARPRVVLALGNYLHGQRRAVLEAACKARGLELRVAGALAGVDEAPEVAMADADVVCGKGRVIIEAMACGRPALVFDQFGFGGWVTPETYAAHEDDHFGGRAGPALRGEHDLAQQLDGYDPGLGLAGRELAMANHSAIVHASRIGAALEGLEPRERPLPELAEFGRMARVQWRLERRAMDARWAAERHRLQLARCEEERDAAQAELATARAELATARAELSAAHAVRTAAQAALDRARGEVAAGEARERDLRDRRDRAEEWIAQVTASRRFAAMRALTRPIDRLRRS